MKNHSVYSIESIIISVITTVVTTITTIFVTYWMYDLQENSKLHDKQEQVCIEFMDTFDEIIKIQSEIQNNCRKSSNKCEIIKQRYIEKTDNFNSVLNKSLMYFESDISSILIELKLKSISLYIDLFNDNFHDNKEILEIFNKVNEICITKVRQTSRIMQ